MNLGCLYETAFRRNTPFIGTESRQKFIIYMMQSQADTRGLCFPFHNARNWGHPVKLGSKCSTSWGINWLMMQLSLIGEV